MPDDGPKFTLTDETKPTQIAGIGEFFLGNEDQIDTLKKKVDAVLPDIQSAIETTFPELAGKRAMPKISYVDGALDRQFHGFSGNRRTAVVREGFGNRIFVNVDAMADKSPNEVAQTLLHEMFHLYTGGALSVTKFMGGNIKLDQEGFDNFTLQNVLAEGGAEYFARQVSDQTSQFGPKDKFHTYADYEAAFERAVEIVGEDVAKGALFDNKIEDINRLIAAVVQVFEAFDEDKAKTCDLDGNCSPFRK